jgi:hypothetical protein
MSNNIYENAWNAFKQQTENTFFQLSDAIYKKQTSEIKDAETQLMMLRKIMYAIDDIERETGIQSGRIITP